MDDPYFPRERESLAPVIASELSSPQAQHRRDATELFVELPDLDRASLALLAGLMGDDAEVRAAAIDLAKDLIGLFTWAEIEPVLERPSSRAGALAVLASGAVTCDRDAASSLVEIASKGAPAERELAMKALAFHVSVAPDLVVPAVREAALGSDRALAMIALESVVSLGCFPTAEREALIAELTVAMPWQQQQWAATWHETHEFPEPCPSCRDIP